MIRLQLSKKDLGEYKATLKDERGQDVTVLEIGGKGKGKAPATPRETRVTAGVTCRVDVPPGARAHWLSRGRGQTCAPGPSKPLGWGRTARADTVGFCEAPRWPV